jgi:biopolymer transport protein ExbD/biopolymer transport protein TolR
MGFSIGGKRGIVSDPNVVPLIDILLVLLVIFMVIPHRKGLDAQLPQSSTDSVLSPDEVVVVQVLADGTLRINQQPVAWDNLGARLGEVFKSRASRTAFIRGDAPVEFGVVIRVIDVMHTSGVATVGLLTPDLEKGF